MAFHAKSPPDLLFGGHLGWRSEDWTDSDDRVRGGSSQSYLRIHNHADYSHAVFTGNLDTETLGGAGFASQRTTSDDLGLDLSSAHGIALAYNAATSDDKIYTFILKDTILPPDPNTGREQSTVSWEYDFRAQDPDIVQNLNLASEQNLRSEEHDLKLLFIPWNEFKPTYRGREVADPEPLKTNQVRRISIMMRSFFATQSGSFKLDVVSIATLSSTSTGITAAQTVPASVSRSECESETTTLQGEYSDRKDDTGSAYPGNQGQSAPQGFWSKLLCR